jgi:hypothetical protein
MNSNVSNMMASHALGGSAIAGPDGPCGLVHPVMGCYHSFRPAKMRLGRIPGPPHAPG